MIFNLEQQQLYTSKFLNALSVERNLSSKTISAYRCDINGLLTWYSAAETDIRFLISWLLKVFGRFLGMWNLRDVKRKKISLILYSSFKKWKYWPKETYFRRMDFAWRPHSFWR